MKRLVWIVFLALVLFVCGPPPAWAASNSAARAEAASTAPVNINTAGVEELVRLPGIGPALAKRIVDYRQTHGPFTKVDDLQSVKGIGPKLLAKIRDRLTVGSPKDAQ